jgi:hypothetical protein
MADLSISSPVSIACLWTSQSSSEKQTQWGLSVATHKERFITGIGSYGYGGQEVPSSAVCKLENQERWPYNSFESKGLRSKDADGGTSSPGPKSKSLELQHPKDGEIVNSPPPQFWSARPSKN